jgi:pyruvate dehydrogenase E2 component (dihydrolipoamide acetyltransferase)
MTEVKMSAQPMTVKEVRVPDIGNYKDVEVIDVSVSAGDMVQVDDALITLETEKASMEVPAPFAGRVREVKTAVGGRVSKGSLIVLLEVEQNNADNTEKQPVNDTATMEAPVKTAAATHLENIPVPDLGNAKKVEVIEVNVKAGDTVAVDDTILTLESEKASMEVPSPKAGVIREIKFKVGDKVSSGEIMMVLEAASGATAESKSSVATESKTSAPAEAKTTPAQSVEKAAPAPAATPVAVSVAPTSEGQAIYASPMIRRLAREFGVDLTKVSGSGRKGRLTKEDVQEYVKQQLARPAGGGGMGLEIPPMPDVDFAQFGEVTTEALSRIKKLSAGFLHRNWVSIPHVTQFDEVDITEMEKFRSENKNQAEKQGFKLTPLVFLLKAVVVCLKAFPHFNASLSKDGTSLIVKKFYHIGVAVNTANGLVVPVIRNVDQKGLLELAKELAEISEKARAGKLTANDMQGGCFSISSLGGIGGTAFTPIINAPEVAILGVSKSQMKPVYENGQFVPRLILPLSLSYDHRVIDGAEAAQFITFLGEQLTDIRRILL